MRSEQDHRAEIGDFTEDAYRGLLRSAKRSYRFVRFGESPPENHVLWRHDLDASVHRAARLAQIERDEGVTATYFLYPRCRYYNLFSTEVSGLVRGIMDLGHDIALHFDPTHYGEMTLEQLSAAMAHERDLLTQEFGRAPVAVSFHLFGVLSTPMPDDDVVCGMVNAYGRTLRDGYGYVSDSNGLWLYRRLKTVLDEAAEARLQVLTHPEWWTPEAMPPRARLQRAIDGYARLMETWYDEIVDRSGRPNLR